MKTAAKIIIPRTKYIPILFIFCFCFFAFPFAFPLYKLVLIEGNQIMTQIKNISEVTQRTTGVSTSVITVVRNIAVNIYFATSKNHSPNFSFILYLQDRSTMLHLFPRRFGPMATATHGCGGKITNNSETDKEKVRKNCEEQEKRLLLHHKK